MIILTHRLIEHIVFYFLRETKEKAMCPMSLCVKQKKYDALYF